MAQPIIYIHQSLKETQIQEIRAIAPAYHIVSSKSELALLNKERIHIMFGWDSKIGKELLDLPTSQLQWVQAISAGVDSYDLSRFRKKGIRLSNGSGIHTVSIAEHVLGVLLAETRGIRKSIQQQARKHWSSNDITYQQLQGQKMLIVGTGKIGQQIARLAQGLGIQTYGINTSGHVTDGFIECYSEGKLSRIVNEMPIIVNALPLTEHTHHLYNSHLFNAMKPSTIFINIGRGPSVKTEELIEALSNGQLSFAALDVFEEEPLPDDSPLWTLDNVLITPHISGLTPHFKTKLLAIFLSNLNSFVTNGTLVKNEVSLDRGY